MFVSFDFKIDDLIDEKTSKFWSMKISMFWLMLHYWLQNIDQSKFYRFQNIDVTVFIDLEISMFNKFFARFLSHLAFHNTKFNLSIEYNCSCIFALKDLSL